MTPARAKKSEEVSVKLNAELARKAKTVASWRGQGLTEYLNEILGPIIRKDAAKVQKELGGDEKE